MSYARQVLDSYPRTVNVDASVLAAADAISEFAQAPSPALTLTWADRTWPRWSRASG
jgi:hypothetical protein